MSCVISLKNENHCSKTGKVKSISNECNTLQRENREIDISSLPQQDLESLLISGQALFNPIPFKNSDQIKYVHSTAGTFNWKYVITTYGNNVFYNASYRFMVNATIVGLAAGIIAEIGNTFAAYK